MVPDKRFIKALERPKETMKLVAEVFRRRWNSWVPMRGTAVRSRPTMPPAKALTSVSKANGGRFAFRPTVIGRWDAAASGAGTAVGSGFEGSPVPLGQGSAPVGADDGLEIGGRGISSGRDPGEEFLFGSRNVPVPGFQFAQGS